MEEIKLFIKEDIAMLGSEKVCALNEKRRNEKAGTFLKKEQKREKRLSIPVVIMAGGLGTRLYPYTKILPKPLIPIGEKPIVEHIIDRFQENGCSQFYMIVNNKKNMIKAYFSEIDKNYTLNYIDEKIPLGTGGGLCFLKNKINSTFILTNCDILIDYDYKKIYKYHKERRNLITMICAKKQFKVPYGVIEVNDNSEIENIREKPEMLFLINTGMYIIDSKVIEEMEEATIGMPDIIHKYRKRGEKVGVFLIEEQKWLDMGEMEEMEKMKKRLEIE